VFFPTKCLDIAPRGHRQKDISEGQTFAKKVGEPILPDFLSIVDDPTEKKEGHEDLLGYYRFDDEGVSTHEVVLVDHGVLKNFEMSRSPLAGFSSFERARTAAVGSDAGFAAGKFDCEEQHRR